MNAMISSSVFASPVSRMEDVDVRPLGVDEDTEAFVLLSEMFVRNAFLEEEDEDVELSLSSEEALPLLRKLWLGLPLVIQDVGCSLFLLLFSYFGVDDVTAVAGVSGGVRQAVLISLFKSCVYIKIHSLLYNIYKHF